MYVNSLGQTAGVWDAGVAGKNAKNGRKWSPMRLTFFKRSSKSDYQRWPLKVSMENKQRINDQVRLQHQLRRSFEFPYETAFSRHSNLVKLISNAHGSRNLSSWSQKLPLY